MSEEFVVIRVLPIDYQILKGRFGNNESRTKRGVLAHRAIEYTEGIEFKLDAALKHVKELEKALKEVS